MSGKKCYLAFLRFPRMRTGLPKSSYNMPHNGENLTRKNKIIGWPIFSCAAGATTKTAAVTNRDERD